MAKARKIPDGLFANFAHMSTKDITDYLDNQGIAVTRTWSDLWEDANAHAKTITGETRVNLINDVFSGIKKSLEQGKGTQITAKIIAQELAKKGWYYGARGGAVQASLAGIDQREALRGSIHRLKIIARQNMQAAYMAGRWKRFQDNKDDRPYIQYVAVRDNSSRPPHAAQHGSVYHIDDPVWNIMWPPNGFNCRCRVRALSERDMKRKNLIISDSVVEKQDAITKKTDETGDSEIVKYRYTIKAKGSESGINIDAGFAYNGGKAQTQPFIPRMGDITVGNEHLLARVAESTDILATGLPAEQYALAFLNEFDVDIDEVKHFTDAAGDVIPVSVDLLTKREKGQPPILKSDKAGRGQYMKILAQTLKDPDEIWLNWENEKGEWVLKRHYLRVLDIDKNLYALAIFKREKGVWYGSTVFHMKENTKPEKMLERLELKRKGIRLYKK